MGLSFWIPLTKCQSNPILGPWGQLGDSSTFLPIVLKFKGFLDFSYQIWYLYQCFLDIFYYSGFNPIQSLDPFAALVPGSYMIGKVVNLYATKKWHLNHTTDFSKAISYFLFKQLDSKIVSP